jgi:hypothetical protein
MATHAHTVCPQPDTIIAIFGDVTEDNDRIAQIEICTGEIPGTTRSFALRCWGRGRSSVAQGRPTHFTDVAGAREAAFRWVDTGWPC